MKKVDLFISLVGFTRFDDFSLSAGRIRMYKTMSYIFRMRLPAAFFYNIVLHPSLLRAFYARTHNAKKKFEHLDVEEKKQMMEFEIVLWRDNDVRTHMQTALEMFTLDNCHKQINLPVHHISVDGDQYFNNDIVEQHMRIIFTDFTDYLAVMPNHAPSIVATREESAPFVPKGLRTLLRKNPKKDQKK